MTTVLEYGNPLVSFLDRPHSSHVDLVIVAGGRHSLAAPLIEEQFGCLKGAICYRSTFFARLLNRPNATSPRNRANENAEGGADSKPSVTDCQVKTVAQKQMVTLPHIHPVQLRAILTWAWTGEFGQVWNFIRQESALFPEDQSATKAQRNILKLDSLTSIIETARDLEFKGFEIDLLAELSERPRAWMLRGLLLKMRFNLPLPPWCHTSYAVLTRVENYLKMVSTAEEFYKLVSPLAAITHSTVALVCALFMGVTKRATFGSQLSAEDNINSRSRFPVMQRTRSRSSVSASAVASYDRGDLDDPRHLVIPARARMRRELESGVPIFVKRFCLPATGDLQEAFKTWYFRNDLISGTEGLESGSGNSSDSDDQGADSASALDGSMLRRARATRSAIVGHHEVLYELGFGLPAFEAVIDIKQNGQIDLDCALVECSDNEADNLDGHDTAEFSPETGCEATPEAKLVESGKAELRISLWLQAHRVAQVAIRKNQDSADPNLLEIVSPHAWNTDSFSIHSPRTMKVVSAAAAQICASNPLAPKPACWITWSLLLLHGQEPKPPAADIAATSFSARLRRSPATVL